MAEEMKQVRISDENIELLKKYGDTPNKAITALLQHPVTVNSSALEQEVRALMSRMDTFMSHGQGGIRVYPMPVDKIDGKLVPRVVELDPATEEKLGFHRASVREEK